MQDCETNVLCQITNIKTDIARLYDRTDDINDLLETCCAEDPVDPPDPPDPPTGFFRTISTEAELDTAKAEGGTWYVTKLVPLTKTHGISKPIQLIGFSLDGTTVGFSLNYIPGAISEEPGVGIGRDMFRLGVHDCVFRELYFTMNHPLGSGTADTGAVISIYGVTLPSDMGGIMIDRCEFKNAAIGMYRSGNAPGVASPLKRLRITNNFFHDFFSGLYINGQVENCTIDNNIFVGKDAIAHNTIVNAATGDELGNAIYISNGIERVIVSRNRCFNVDRHAIEIFNYQPGLNQQTQVINNVCNDCAFGISCTGNESMLIHGNSILRAKQIGIEVVGFSGTASAQEIIVSNNWIKDVTFLLPPFQPSPTQTQGIAVTCVNCPTLICDNQIIKITSPIVSTGPETHLDAMGIQLYGVIGAADLRGVKYVTIRGNRFTDAGNRMIWINGHSDGFINTADRFDAVNIEGNTFVFSNQYTGLFKGKVGAENIYSSIYIGAPLGSVAVRNNVSFYDEAHPEYGTYNFKGVGTVFVGSGTDPGIIQAAAGDSLLAGSNVRIPHQIPA